MTSLVAQMAKHLPTMQETQVQSLGQEDPLEKETVTHSSTLAWKIPWMEEPGRLHPWGRRVGHDRATSVSFFHVGKHPSWSLVPIGPSVTNLFASLWFTRVTIKVTMYFSSPAFWLIFDVIDQNLPPILSSGSFVMLT